MKVEVVGMLTGSPKIIRQYPVFARNVNQTAAMNDCFRQTGVSVMLRFQIFNGARGRLGLMVWPAGTGDLGSPAKCSGALCLIPAVNRDGVVSARGSKVSTPLRLAVVSKRTRVDKQFPAMTEQADGESIGVSVTARQHTEPSEVEYQMAIERSPAGAFNVVTSIRAEQICFGRRSAFQRIVGIPSLLAEQPEVFLGERPSLIFEIRPAKHNGPGAQRIIERAVGPLLQSQRAAPIVVSQRRDCAVGPGNVHQEAEHVADFLADLGRHGELVPIGEDERLKVKVEGVTVVVRRQFCVHPVRQNLPVGFLPQEPGAFVKPTGSTCLISKNQPSDEEGCGLADQMRVWTAIQRCMPAN